MSTYARQSVAFERGDGPWLWDRAGRRYLDALSGIAVCGLGHAHPAVAQAVCEQARTLVHTSNLYTIDVQARLAEQLCALAAMESAFFCNSGAEANEAAIKLARRYAHERAIEAPHIVVMDGSFHGRTLATLTATGNAQIQAGFEPLVPGFARVPYNDLSAIDALAEAPGICAVLVEPIQGEGGVRMPDQGYLRALRNRCDERGWLLMLDEVQTGMGRTGRWLCHQHEEAARPDVVTLAKALGNGFPIGACLARGEAAQVLTPGSHGTTFGGSPLACRAALAVLETIEHEGLCERAAALGDELLTGLRERLAGLGGVVSVRGRGLMVGIELDRPCAELVARALAEGLLINVTAERVVRLLPPLIIELTELRTIVDTVSRLVHDFLAES